MNTKKIAIVALVVIGAVSGLVWWRCAHRNGGLVYDPQGFGGLRRADQRPPRKSTDPLAPAVASYNKREYQKAEAAAQRVVEANANSKDPAKRRKSVEARYVLAFSAARRKDMAQARDRFAVMRNEAAKLPDKGKQAPMPGAAQPTLEEEAAYQHAVCTAALGDKKAAEAEYMKLIRD